MPALCARCSRPLGCDGGADSWSGAYLYRSPPFEHARAAMTYGDVLQNIIFAFKHGDRLDLEPLVITWFYAPGSTLVADADLVVPVPARPSRFL